MIVGTVQQEEDCSWQDVCKSWAEQDEEMAAGVHQVRLDHGAAEMAARTGKEAARQPPEASREAQQSEGLLLDGEEQEYFLELLMRRASPERPKVDQPAGGIEDSRNRATSAKGKEKKRSKKKEKRALRKGKVMKEVGEQEKREGAAGLTSNLEKQTSLDLLNNPEAKGRGLVDGYREEEGQVTRSQMTSRGECSGQKMPDCS